MSAKVIYVKPARTNSKFWHNPEVKGYQYFPETQKGYPPYWDFKEFKYRFYGMTDDEALALAYKCKLSYVDGINEGRIIDSIDLKHKEDSFFNHPRMINKIKDDVTTFNLNDPLDQLKLATFKMYPVVAHSENDKKKIAGAKWVVVDKDVEQSNAEQDYLAKMEINKFFVPGKDKLSPEKMRMILASFNDTSLKFDNTTSTDTISAWLYDKATDTRTVQGVSNQQRFLNLVSMQADELAIRSIIDKAVKLGVLRIKTGKYLYAGNEVAVSQDILVKKLMKADNQTLLNAIEDEIEFKSK
jgi:hypothetical protein